MSVTFPPLPLTTNRKTQMLEAKPQFAGATDTFTPRFQGNNAGTINEEAEIAKVTIAPEDVIDKKGGSSGLVRYIGGVFNSNKGQENQAKLRKLFTDLDLSPDHIAAFYPGFVRAVDNKNRFYWGDWTVNNQRQAEKKIGAVLNRVNSKNPAAAEQGQKELYLLLKFALREFKFSLREWEPSTAATNAVQQMVEHYERQMPLHYKEIKTHEWIG